MMIMTILVRIIMTPVAILQYREQNSNITNDCPRIAMMPVGLFTFITHSKEN